MNEWRDHPCIEWQGFTEKYGYGRFTANGVRELAHRAAWINANGPIPDGLCVLHHCDNRRCINPAHLFLGTRRDNNRDRDAKGRVAKGRRNGRSKLTDEQVALIKASPESHVDAAKRFGVSRWQVYAIRTGRRR